MAKAGRKPKSGRREPNGRLQRPTVDRLNEMAAQQRRREQQTVLDQPHRRDLGERMDHKWAESALGRLCLRRKLREELYEAGIGYGSIVACWRGAKGIPRSDGRGEGGSCSAGPDDASVKRWQAQMVAVERAMMREGTDAFLAVRMMVLDHGDIGMDQDEAAISGLSAVAVELGLMRAGEHVFGS